MIKVYKNKKLLHQFKYLNMSNEYAIDYVFDKLVRESKIEAKWDVPDLCESPKQYIMRENWFILLSY